MYRVKASAVHEFEDVKPFGYILQTQNADTGSKKQSWKSSLFKLLLLTEPGKLSKSLKDKYRMQENSARSMTMSSEIKSATSQIGVNDSNVGPQGAAVTDSRYPSCDESKQSILLTVSFEALVAICEELGEADRVRLRFISRDLRSLLDQGDWYWRRMTTQHMTSEAVTSLVDRTQGVPWSLRFAGECRHC